ncbi:MAG: hypothetical protein JNL83_34850 [Myxococcales bacterium]|nr:hypothetical protein [Myxococcales bacterium]
MLKWLIRNRLAAFEKEYGYDTSYARDLLAWDTGAFLAFARIQKMSTYRKGAPVAAWYAAKLVGTMAEDCGPCTQLMVTMALKQKVDPKVLSAVLRSDDENLPEDVWLAVRFARASLDHAVEAEALRETVVAKWGERGLISLAFALTLSRVYPTLKYALGHGKACQRVVVAGAPVMVTRAAA